MFVSDLLAHKKILITGGGSGLGKSMATRFVELGANVTIAGRRESVLAGAAEEIVSKTGKQVATIHLDVRDPRSVEHAFDEAWTEGPLDILVNNAAANFIARTETLSSRAWDAVIDTVLKGTAYCTTAVGKRWIGAGRGGVILNIVSSGAWAGNAYTAPSASAKAGVLTLTKTLAAEWGPKGIRTVAIAPGMFPTEGAWKRLLPEGTESTPRVDDVPLKRYGEHIELANLASYLISDQASYINGECVLIDGGRVHGGVGGVAVRDLHRWNDQQWTDFRQGLAE